MDDTKRLIAFKRVEIFDCEPNMDTTVIYRQTRITGNMLYKLNTSRCRLVAELNKQNPEKGRRAVVTMALPFGGEYNKNMTERTTHIVFRYK